MFNFNQLLCIGKLKEQVLRSGKPADGGDYNPALSNLSPGMYTRALRRSVCSSSFTGKALLHHLREAAVMYGQFEPSALRFPPSLTRRREGTLLVGASPKSNGSIALDGQPGSVSPFLPLLF